MVGLSSRNMCDEYNNENIKNWWKNDPCRFKNIQKLFSEKLKQHLLTNESIFLNIEPKFMKNSCLIA
jgi:hypothetical protein